MWVYNVSERFNIRRQQDTWGVAVGLPRAGVWQGAQWKPSLLVGLFNSNAEMPTSTDDVDIPKLDRTRSLFTSRISSRTSDGSQTTHYIPGEQSSILA